MRSREKRLATLTQCLRPFEQLEKRILLDLVPQPAIFSVNEEGRLTGQLEATGTAVGDKEFELYTRGGVTAWFGDPTVNADGSFVMDLSDTRWTDFNGTVIFQFRVRDTYSGVWSDPANVTVNVAQVNDLPYLVTTGPGAETDPITRTLDEDEPQTFPFGFWDADLDPYKNGQGTNVDTMKWEVAQNPLHGKLEPTADLFTFTYTPDKDFFLGGDTAKIKISDKAGASLTKTVNFTINPVNDQPIVLIDTGTAHQRLDLLIPFDISYGGYDSDTIITLELYYDFDGVRDTGDEVAIVNNLPPTTWMDHDNDPTTPDILGTDTYSWTIPSGLVGRTFYLLVRSHDAPGQGGQTIPNTIDEVMYSHATFTVIDPYPGDPLDLILEEVSNREGIAAEKDCFGISMTSDGRFIVFDSKDSVLVPSALDSLGFSDIFLYNFQTDTIQVISRTAEDTPAMGDGDSINADISADGRYIVFQTRSSNLVEGDGNEGLWDILLYDRQAATLEESFTLVSHKADGTDAGDGDSTNPDISDDGSFIVFQSKAGNLVAEGVDTNGADDVFIYNVQTGQINIVSRANGVAKSANKASINPSIGTVVSGQNVTTYVAYASLATDLLSVPGSATQQVYLTVISPSGTYSTMLVSANPETLATGLAPSNFPDISSDGNFIAFESDANNLTDESSTFKDVYLFDLSHNAMFLVSQSYSGNPASGNSSKPSVSDDGRFVTFLSKASNLVSGVAPGTSTQTYIRDMWAPGVANEMISRNLAGVPANAASSETTLLPSAPGYADEVARIFPIVNAEGRWVAFLSRSTNLDGTNPGGKQQVFLKQRVFSPGLRPLLPDADMMVGTWDNVDIAWLDSDPFDNATISIYYTTDIVTDPWNSGTLIQQIDEDSVVDGTGWAIPAGLSGDYFIALTIQDSFRAAAGLDPLVYYCPTDEVPAVITVISGLQPGINRITAKQTREDITSPIISMDMSATGRYIVLDTTDEDMVPNDENLATDVFWIDRGGSGSYVLVSHIFGDPDVPGVNASFDPKVSYDGLHVVFSSDADDLIEKGVPTEDSNGYTDIYMYVDGLPAGNNIFMVSRGAGNAPAGGASGGAVVNGDGRFVAFHSDADNLVAPDTNFKSDVFLYEVRPDTGQIVNRILVSPGLPVQDEFGVLQPQSANGASFNPDISEDGRYVVFESFASNLTEDFDTNGRSDIFLFDRRTGKVELISKGLDGISSSNGTSSSPCISGDGRYIAFSSTSSDLVEGDTNNRRDVFIYDRELDYTYPAWNYFYGTEINNADSSDPQISGDGRFVAFTSRASNLVPGDTNGAADIFVFDNYSFRITLESKTFSGGQTSVTSSNFNPVINWNGLFLGFLSNDRGLVDGIQNFVADAFVVVREHPVIWVDLPLDDVELDIGDAYDILYATFSPDVNAMLQDEPHFQADPTVTVNLYHDLDGLPGGSSPIATDLPSLSGLELYTWTTPESLAGRTVHIYATITNSRTDDDFSIGTITIDALPMLQFISPTLGATESLRQDEPFEIVWLGGDLNNPEATLDLWWDRDLTFGNGNEFPIASDLLLDQGDGRGAYFWTTEDVPFHLTDINIYGFATGGNKNVEDYAKGRIRILEHVELGGTRADRIEFVDPDGTTVTVIPYLSKANVYLDANPGMLLNLDGRTIKVTGTNVTLNGVKFTQSSSYSALYILANGGDGLATVGGIDTRIDYADGGEQTYPVMSLGRIFAPNVNVIGDVIVNGWLGSMYVAGIMNGADVKGHDGGLARLAVGTPTTIITSQIAGNAAAGNSADIAVGAPLNLYVMGNVSNASAESERDLNYAYIRGNAGQFRASALNVNTLFVGGTATDLSVGFTIDPDSGLPEVQSRNVYNTVILGNTDYATFMASENIRQVYVGGHASNVTLDARQAGNLIFRGNLRDSLFTTNRDLYRLSLGGGSTNNRIVVDEGTLWMFDMRGNMRTTNVDARALGVVYVGGFVGSPAPAAAPTQFHIAAEIGRFTLVRNLQPATRWETFTYEDEPILP
ncbi:MAG TPA: Ig-like domain-containing protein [Candidatus Brocadiia bacterium]|nr:Ig-like domain-containing protein [Candidatus Brocadiia bacterium]